MPPSLLLPKTTKRGFECSPEGWRVFLQYGLTGGFVAMNLAGVIYAFGIQAKKPVCPHGSFTCCDLNFCNTSLSALPLQCPLGTQSQCVIDHHLQDPELALSPTNLGIGVTSSILFPIWVLYLSARCGYRYRVASFQ